MFTGIVERTGIVKKLSRGRKACGLSIEAKGFFSEPKIGGSVSVNGVCLTIVDKTPDTASFDVILETLKRSALGTLSAGSRVNLELPLKWEGRVEGHFVQGHVDAVGTVETAVQEGPEWKFQIEFASKLRRFIVEKGSVSVNGVSLTVGKVKQNQFWVHIIPHTLKQTNFGDLKRGSRVNLEVDLLAKLALS